MNNIWFLRTDKDEYDQIDFNPDHKNIYSLHGVCGKSELINEYKAKIFPNLLLSRNEVISCVNRIKSELIKSGFLRIDKPGIARCNIVIAYWLAVMSIGDIVFVRNKQNKVFVCKIIGYVDESFFEMEGFFKRPVEILGLVMKNSIHERVWKRTMGRKTIERNADKEVDFYVKKYIDDLLKSNENQLTDGVADARMILNATGPKIERS